jgi:hypothetical protein
MKPSSKKAIELLLVQIKKDKEGIKKLLKTNGVRVDIIKTDNELARTFVTVLSKSKQLFKDYTKYLEDLSKGEMSADGFTYWPPPELKGSLFTEDISVLPNKKSDSYQNFKTTSLPIMEVSKTQSGGKVIGTIDKYLTKVGDLATLYKEIVSTDAQREEALLMLDNTQPINNKQDLLIYGSLALLGTGLIVGIVYYLRKK